ncbi:MAG: hypothetical protein ACPIG7_05100 [Akkermansiaceae bacterium]
MKIIATILALSLSALSAQDSLKVGNFTFKPEKSWVIGKTSSHMVKAALNHGEKNGPLLKFYHFGKGQGGGVEANIQRWKRQFENGEAKVTPEDKTFGNQKLTIVTMTGTYMVGPMMARNKTATPKYMLLGAIIPHPSGDVFLKMLGKEVDLIKTKPDFAKLIASAFGKAAE